MEKRGRRICSPHRTKAKTAHNGFGQGFKLVIWICLSMIWMGVSSLQLAQAKSW
jgi:hypothetical protein